VDVK
jgi:septal ring factor EnvC (AmiA/AmiB activator)